MISLPSDSVRNGNNVSMSLEWAWRSDSYALSSRAKSRRLLLDGVKLYMDITNVLLGQTVLTEQTNTSRALNAGQVHRSRLP